MSGSTIFESQVPGLLRRVRRVAGLSQRALAEEIGVSKSVVARWESGQRLPRSGCSSRPPPSPISVSSSSTTRTGWFRPCAPTE
ncbi:helix-turn-helix domain-containing protein [Nocardioides gansuensis]